MFCAGLRDGHVAALEQRARLVLEEAAALDELDVVELHALFLDARRERRHRARRRPADVGVVAARADVEGRPLLLSRVRQRAGVRAFEVDRRDDGDVGQVRAAVVRVVERVHVAALHRAGVARDHGLDRLAHRAEVHRHVRRVGDQVAVGVEEGAREVEPLLDVHRVGRVLQLQAHLLGDVHEEVVEDLEQDRIDRRADRAPRLARHRALEDEVVERGDARGPAGLDHRRRVALDDDRRAGDRLARPGTRALDERGVVPAAVAEHPHRRRDRRRRRGHRAHARLRRRVAGADRLHRHGLDDQPAPFHQEGEALAVRGLEAACNPTGSANGTTSAESVPS